MAKFPKHMPLIFSRRERDSRMAKYSNIVKNIARFFGHSNLFKKELTDYLDEIHEWPSFKPCPKTIARFLDEVREWPSFKPGLQILKSSNKVYKK